MNEIVIIFAFVFILFFTIIFIISQRNFKNSEKIISAFSEFDLKKIKIKLSETSYTGLSQYGGITKNADLYYFNNILIFLPSKENHLNRLFNNLPTILIAKKTNDLPLGLSYKMIKDISINKLITLTYSENVLTKRRVEFVIHSETENTELNKAITKFKSFL